MIGIVKIPPVNGSGPAASTPVVPDIYPTIPFFTVRRGIAETVDRLAQDAVSR